MYDKLGVDVENLSRAHTVGQVIMKDNNKVKDILNKTRKVPAKILLDSGAISSNYISKEYFEKIKKDLGSNNIVSKRTVTLLADKITKCVSPGVVKLQLWLYDEYAKRHYYTGTFKILESLSCDLIIGLPALIGALNKYFIQLLQYAAEITKGSIDKEKGKVSKNMNENMDHRTNMSARINEELQYLNAALEDPWTTDNHKIAPEDEQTPNPVQFEDYIQFLSKTRQEALTEYNELISTHVSDELRNKDNIMNMLKDEFIDVFVPKEWKGISRIPPLKLQWKDTLPDKIRAKARPINPRLYENCQKEFDRLLGYMYRKSTSPWTACLVVAPKATKPYIRCCGDYRIINQYIKVGHFPIPVPKNELHKILGFKMFLDIDMTNAFHQIVLDPDTSEKLSIQTPWGQFEPVFMPEGVAPGTTVLQSTVFEIFKDFGDWTIVIFDNLLILCKDANDAEEKLRIFLQRCKDYGIILKMAKSYIGFDEVKFFGYTCRHDSYEVSKDKLVAFENLPFPKTLKQARSALGMGVMFASFIPHYSTIAAPLSDMTKKDYSWDKTKWKGIDYEAKFQEFIEAIKTACTLFFPDYEKVWILRTDASLRGVAAVLYQVEIDNDGKITSIEPIGVVSQKFSDQASNWDTIEQEAYGIYFGIYSFSYLLIGKEFIVETDHNNLRWIEASKVPKIIRWRVYMQSFMFQVRHIKGKDNTVADWFSREFEDLNNLLEGYDHTVTMSDALLYYLNDETDEWDKFVREEDEPFNNLHNGEMYTKCDGCGSYYVLNEMEEICEEKQSSLECFKAVHNARMGHMGGRRTWNRLNKEFPGHKIPFQHVVDMVGDCPICIKARIGMENVLVPIVRHLKQPEFRSALGIDALQITPKGIEGQTHIMTCVNLFAKHTYLQPIKGDTAENMATVVWQYWCNFGYTDTIISDRGPDLTSKLFKQLTELTGVRHVFSITDKHANGCERVIKEVQRHLRVMATETNCRDIFKDPTWIPSAQLILNSEKSSETGVEPFSLMFGTLETNYGSWTHSDKIGKHHHEYVQTLNTNLKELRDISRKYQLDLINERAEVNPDPEKQNQFQPGDLVMYYAGPKPHPKMAATFLGPYEVIKQYKNDVTVKNLIDGSVKEFSLEDLKLYTGNKEAGVELALQDTQQHHIERIIGYRGEPSHRTSMKFILEYADGDIGPKSFDKDISSTKQFEDFCKARPHLFQLTMPKQQADKWINTFKRQQITDLTLGDSIYVSLRWYSDIWYQDLNLPDAENIEYMLLFKTVAWVNRSKTKILVENQVDGFNKDRFPWTNYDVYAWGHTRTLDDQHRLVTPDLIAAYPAIVASN